MKKIKVTCNCPFLSDMKKKKKLVLWEMLGSKTIGQKFFYGHDLDRCLLTGVRATNIIVSGNKQDGHL